MYIHSSAGSRRHGRASQRRRRSSWSHPASCSRTRARLCLASQPLLEGYSPPSTPTPSSQTPNPQPRRVSTHPSFFFLLSYSQAHGPTRLHLPAPARASAWPPGRSSKGIRRRSHPFCLSSPFSWYKILDHSATKSLSDLAFSQT